MHSPWDAWSLLIFELNGIWRPCLIIGLEKLHIHLLIHTTVYVEIRKTFYLFLLSPIRIKIVKINKVQEPIILRFQILYLPYLSIGNGSEELLVSAFLLSVVLNKPLKYGKMVYWNEHSYCYCLYISSNTDSCHSNRFNWLDSLGYSVSENMTNSSGSLMDTQ